jgi:DNA-directed RNA polymerase specialized sigma24 family protein
MRRLPFLSDSAATRASDAEASTAVRIVPPTGGANYVRKGLVPHTLFELDPEKGKPVPRVARPKTREDCLAGGHNEARPCPFVSCRHHLAIEVDEDEGDLSFAFPGKQPWELAETCALDVAERGGATLEVVSDMFDLTRERIRQIEGKALGRLKHVSRSAVLAPFKDAEFGAYNGLGVSGGANESPRSEESPPPATEDEVEDESSRRPLYSCGREPRFGEGDEDAGFAQAEADWFFDQKTKQESEAGGKDRTGFAIQMLHGVPLNPRAAQAIEFVRVCWAERGAGPSALDIADALGIEGATDEARRTSIGVLLQGVREAGLLRMSRTTGAELVEPRPKKETPDDAETEGAGQLRAQRGEGGDGARDGAGGRTVRRAARDDQPLARAGAEHHRRARTRAQRGTGDRDLGDRHRTATGATGPAPAPGAVLEQRVAPATVRRVFVAPESGPADVVEFEEEPPPPATPQRDESKPKEIQAMADLTEKQQEILKRYEAGENGPQIAKAMGTTQAAVDSCVYVLRKRGLVTRAKRAGGRLKGAAKQEVAPKARVNARARQARPSKETKRAVTTGSAAEREMVANARARIEEIDEKIGPLVAEKTRLEAVIQTLAG